MTNAATPAPGDIVDHATVEICVKCGCDGAGLSEPPYEAEQVKQAHAHLLDIVLRRQYSGHSLQTAIRALIAATHSATIQPR